MTQDRTPSAEALAEEICRDCAELPDRTSPDDYPDHLLVTPDELQPMIVTVLDAYAAQVSAERVKAERERCRAAGAFFQIKTRYVGDAAASLWKWANKFSELAKVQEYKRLHQGKAELSYGWKLEIEIFRIVKLTDDDAALTDDTPPQAEE